jgi:hypothetical protein
MSSLYLERLPWSLRRAGAAYVPAVLTLLAGAPVGAAEIYLQPFGEVTADINSNRQLRTTDPRPTSEGYLGIIGGTWNINTPESNTIVRPQLGYSKYPQVRENAWLTVVDLVSQYRFVRGELVVAGQFDRRDTNNSELANAAFNPVNPNLPTAPETGRINVRTSRTLGMFAPNYKYELTPRLSWAVSGIYQDVDFGGTNAKSYVPFRYYLGGTSLSWVATQRLDTSFGVYGSRESAKDGSGSVNAGGVKVGFDFKWSRLFTSHLELFAEHDNSTTVTTVTPVAIKETSNGGGGTFSTAWKGEVSRVMLSVGRTFTPSGSGGKFAADHAQVEYHRDLSQRLTFSAAAIYNRYKALSTAYRGANYDYVNATANLRWMLTPTWYVQGGAGYIWDKFPAPTGSAHNDMLYITFGYEGLRRPQ